MGCVPVRVRAEEDPPRRRCAHPRRADPFVSSGVWASEDTLVLSLYPHGLVRVAADGGVPEPIPQQDTTLWLFLQSLTADERAVIATDGGSQERQDAGP